ncbi:hypothetical protein [Halovulum sp. GXIMD14793]
MTRFLTIRICLIAALWSGAAAAQPVIQVRAAEHPGYSRLIVPLPGDATWVISQDGPVSTVVFPGLRAEFDLSGVFNRMPRTRVVALASRNTALGTALDLTLTCSCEVNAERIGSRFLAIDVSRETSANAPTAARRVLNPFAVQDEGAEAPPSKPAAEQSADAQEIAEPTQSDVSEAALADRPRSDAEMAEMKPSAANGTPNTMPSTTTTKTTEADAPLTQVQRDLRAQFANAAAEGLLQLAEPQVTPPSTYMQEQTVPDQVQGADQAEDENEEQGDDTAQTPTLAQLAARLADAQIKTRLPLAVSDIAAETAETRPACNSDMALNVARWGSGLPMVEEIGMMRRDVVSEYGTVDTEAVADLARLYLLNGFGREAKAVLSLASGAPRDHDLLAELADVIEGQPVPSDGVLARSGDCEGRISMWRAVAGFEMLDRETERGDAILRAFSELPPELRRIAGQNIASRALDDGRIEAAASILEILDRTPGSRGALENIARAELSNELGEVRRATTLIADVESTNVAERREALLMRARSVLDESSEVPGNLISDLAIEQRLLRGTDEAVTISLVMAELETRRGQPFVALDILEQDHVIRAAPIPEAARKILDEMDPASLSEGDYVRLVARGTKYLGRDGFSETLRTGFARELNMRGLPNMALEILKASKAMPTAEQRLLRAELEIALSMPRDALETLADMRGTETAQLRSHAHLLLGSPAGAFQSLADLPQSNPQRNKFAALSQNWSEVKPDALPSSFRGFAASFSLEAAENADIQQSGLEGAATDESEAIGQPAQAISDKSQVPATGSNRAGRSEGEVEIKLTSLKDALASTIELRRAASNLSDELR